jgi:hypothetical protein
MFRRINRTAEALALQLAHWVAGAAASPAGHGASRRVFLRRALKAASAVSVLVGLPGSAGADDCPAGTYRCSITCPNGRTASTCCLNADDCVTSCIGGTPQAICIS